MMAYCVKPAGKGEVPMSSTLNPARSRLDLALSEFSKARWATEPSVDAPLQPTDLDVVASAPSSLGKQASFALARFLIAFCMGVAATLAWQSYGDAARKTIASSSPQPGRSAPQAAPEATPRGIEAGGFVVQLSAQRSEAEAQAAFRTMQAKYAVLSGRQPLIRRKDQGERGIFYAAQLGPFGVKSDADQLCETLKSAGGTCFVQKN
jgi:sporulation related protein